VEAARQIGQKNTRLSQRQKIMKSLRQSGIMASASVPVLLDSYRTQETSGRHDILDFLGHLLDTGVDLSPHAAAIGMCLSEINTALREKTVALLVRMGPAAQAAETAALGCTRNALREMRLAGLRVLAAIGRNCSSSAVARLQALLASVPAADLEMREAVEAALAAASGTDRQALAPTEQEVRKKVRALLATARPSELTPQVIEEIHRRLATIPERLLLHALFACFAAHEPGIRAAAALLLQRHRQSLGPFIKIIARAFRSEPERHIKEYISILLSWVLQDLKSKKQAFKPQTANGETAANDSPPQ